MGLLRHRKPPQVAAPAPPPERPQVRAYRELLGTLPAPHLERLHRRALGALDPLTRASILHTAQRRLLSGADLTVDDVPGLARLVVRGELHTPGVVIAGLGDVGLDRLSGAVVMLHEAEQAPPAEAPQVKLTLVKNN